jgi:hypothetical protein
VRHTSPHTSFKVRFADNFRVNRPCGCAAYAVLTEVPPVFLLYDSPFWSGAFLIFIFGVSVWNGGGFYIEVFGRKCVTRSSAVRSLVLTCMRRCLSRG